MIEFQVNYGVSTPFPHYWELCVGSCHAYTALRADYQEQLKKAHDELGFRYVRFHGLFDDDMCVCVRRQKNFTEAGEIVYNFINTDKIFDFLLRIGMKPFIEIGFMPTCLASGSKTCFHYKGNITPPADYERWKDFIRAFTQHNLDRYGEEEVASWFFEVWNEPNLSYFFDGTRQDYFKLYQNTAQAVKSVSSRLKVGGPATSINAWIPELIEFCEKNAVPLDFISTHHYPTDDPLWKNSGMSVEELFKAGAFGKYERGILKKMAEKAKREAGDYPLYYTEWNTSAMLNDDLHDECYASAMIAKTLADNDGLVNGYSYWTFTDIFEESGQLEGVFHGGFGLQTCDGIEKPAYRIFELFHGLGEQRVQVISSRPDATVELLAAKTESGLRLIAYNHNTPGEAVEAQDIRIAAEGIPPIRRVTERRIDEGHCNPKRIWREAGAPAYLKQEQAEALRKASVLKPEPADPSLSFAVPVNGVLAVDIEW